MPASKSSATSSSNTKFLVESTLGPVCAARRNRAARRSGASTPSRDSTPHCPQKAQGRSMLRPCCLKTQITLQFYSDGLYLSVIRQSIFAEFAPNSRLLVAAERRSRVEHVLAIYPHRSRAHSVRDGMRLGDVLGPDRRGESIHALVGAIHYLVEVLELENGHDRPEDLFLRDLHVVLYVGEHRGLDEVALIAHAVAAGHQLGLLLLPGVNVAHHFVELVLIHLRPLLGVLVEGIADGALLRACHALVHKLVVNSLFDVQP